MYQADWPWQNGIECSHLSPSCCYHQSPCSHSTRPRTSLLLVCSCFFPWQHSQKQPEWVIISTNTSHNTGSSQSLPLCTKDYLPWTTKTSDFISHFSHSLLITFQPHWSSFSLWPCQDHAAVAFALALFYVWAFMLQFRDFHFRGLSLLNTLPRMVVPLPTLSTPATLFYFVYRNSYSFKWYCLQIYVSVYCLSPYKYLMAYSQSIFIFFFLCCISRT